MRCLRFTDRRDDGHGSALTHCAACLVSGVTPDRLSTFSPAPRGGTTEGSMGWASGSELAERVWDAVKDRLPEEYRRAAAREIVHAFENMDCDTIREADELWKAAHSRAKAAK